MKNFIWILSGLLLLTSCNQTGKAGSDADSLAVDSQLSTVNSQLSTDDGKHNEEYITQRVNEMYKTQDDDKNCSERYMKLYKEATQLSRDGGMTFLDRDHWLQGNDVDEDWSYRVLEVKDIEPATATARVLVSNFNEHEVTLKLVFERDDWYVDNFLVEAEGGYGGPDAKPEIYDEFQDIQAYVTAVRGDNEIAKKLVGEWGWVGDGVPELLLKFTMKDGTLKSLKAEECYLYRLYTFHNPLCGVYDGTLQIGQRPDNDAIDLSLKLNEKGDELKGHIMVKLANFDYSYNGDITLRKNYFRYKDK